MACFTCSDAIRLWLGVSCAVGRRSASAAAGERHWLQSGGVNVWLLLSLRQKRSWYLASLQALQPCMQALQPCIYCSKVSLLAVLAVSCARVANIGRTAGVPVWLPLVLLSVMHLVTA